MKKIVFIVFLVSLFFSCSTKQGSVQDIIIKQDKHWILDSANVYLEIDPVTVTARFCERSEGGKHDFYSEGDYWWTNPDNPNGPYIRRDGQSNPDNFTFHRIAMRDMSVQVSALTAAYILSKDEKYAKQALKHFRAWFIDEETKMSPHMKYAQAISGRVSGRGVGLIDGIHFVEPVQALMILKKYNQISDEDYRTIQNWFKDFLIFMNQHEYGIDERERKNNHGTCWVMQVVQFAKLTENDEVLNDCRERVKTVILPNQLASDGSFPLELARTKPYGYSLFNLDALAIVAQILTTEADNLWIYSLADGQSIGTALDYMFPYIKDKNTWPLKADIMYWDEWPARHPALLFGGDVLERTEYIQLWKSLKPLPETAEGIRNFPLRYPILWY